MKQLLTISLLLSTLVLFAQVDDFHLQGQIVDKNGNPVSDAYIINPRNMVKSVSKSTGIFDVFISPGDSMIITHISFIRKVVTAHRLMVDPVVQLEPDTISIRQVNIGASKRSDYEKAMENIKSIEFDFRPQPDDLFTENERMKNLLNTENRVESAASHSVNILRFSPSEEISKRIEKRKKRREAKQFSSTKGVDREEIK